MNADVYKLSGAPGVGKTRRLFEYVREEKSSGTSVTDLYYLTFARSARAESAAKLMDTFPEKDGEEVAKRAKTFHGATWVACAVNGLWEDANKQVIQPSSDKEVYQTFCNKTGLSYSGQTDALKAMRDGKDLKGNGDKLFAIADWLRLTRRPPEKHYLAPTTLNLEHDRVVSLLNEWKEYKRSGGPNGDLPLYEHGDYVDEAIKNHYRPPASVLFIDEFQDLAPQEYLLFKQWRDSGDFDRIYIAGDENQSIYSFRAGTPMYFEQTDVAETESRKMSYRCPAEIVDVAREVLRSCEHTDPRGFGAHKQGGEAREVMLDDAEQLAAHAVEQARTHDGEYGSPSVFILARANYQARSIARALRNNGVPYDYLGGKQSAWREPLPDLLKVLRQLRDPNGGISKQAVDTLLKHSPRESERRDAVGQSMGDVYEAEKVAEAYTDLGGPREIATSLDLETYQTDLLVGAVGTHQVEAGDIRIGTIHSSKGLEAPCVLLMRNTTSRLKDEYYRDTDVAAEEHRIGYVGATRASETLHLVGGFFKSPVSPVFEDGLPKTPALSEAWEVDA